MHHKSVGQATVDKGHAGWNVELRPVYMDAQVRFGLHYFVIACTHVPECLTLLDLILCLQF